MENWVQGTMMRREGMNGQDEKQEVKKSSIRSSRSSRRSTTPKLVPFPHSPPATDERRGHTTIPSNINKSLTRAQQGPMMPPKLPPP